MKQKGIDGNGKKQISFACMIAALVLFVLACSLQKGPLKVLFIILTALVAVAGILLFTIGQYSRGKNLFLYDRRRKCAVSVEALTFEIVDDDLNYYISPFCEDALSLFGGFPKELNMQLQAEPSFCTPIAYKMLCELSHLPENDIYRVYAAADERTVAALCRIISANDDKEMADLIFWLKRNAATEEPRISHFFAKNKPCFEIRLLHYVQKHIAEFEIGR